MPANGTPSPTASPRAAARPTRTPVKLPGPIGDGNELTRPAADAGLGKDGLDGRQQARRLVAARFCKTGKPHAVAHHGHAHAADGAIEGEDRHACA